MMNKVSNYDYLTSQQNIKRNLLDVCYEHLEDSAEINMLNKASPMYTLICNYVRNTQLHQPTSPIFYNPGAFDVDEVFEVIRYEDELRYQPYEENVNRQLLFHGSHISNFVDILTNGLKISPPEEHFTGSIFGKGIYFSDSVSKAAGYCCSTNGTGLVLLCEVAAGLADIRYHKANKPLKKFCESVQAIGQYYPHLFHVRPDGLKIPNGTLILRPEQTGLTLNEFVVFDESRVKIRYLIKLKMHGKRAGN